MLLVALVALAAAFALNKTNYLARPTSNDAALCLTLIESTDVLFAFILVTTEIALVLLRVFLAVCLMMSIVAALPADSAAILSLGMIVVTALASLAVPMEIGTLTDAAELAINITVLLESETNTCDAHLYLLASVHHARSVLLADRTLCHVLQLTQDAVCTARDAHRRSEREEDVVI
jgi:hypothetical protein